MPRQREQSFVSQVVSEFAAAKDSRFRRRRVVPTMGASADYHFRNQTDYLKVLEYARDFDRNDAVVSQLVDRACDNLVGDGITADPQTGSEELDRRLEELWCNWTEDPNQCDVAGELTWADFQWLSTRHSLVDGDCFVLLTESGKLQLIESHRCRQPPKSYTAKTALGVELDNDRKRLKYWFSVDDIDPLKTASATSKFNSVEVRKPIPLLGAELEQRVVLQIYDPKRSTQTRGVTAFAPIFDVLGMFEDLNFAKLVQAQVVSCFAILRSLDKNAEPTPGAPVGSLDTSQTRADGTTRTLSGVSPGLEITSKPGETLEGFSPGVPNAEFFDHVKLILTLIGINLGMPLVLVLLDASETNFSGWRGAIDQARLGFRRKQRHQIGQLHQPVYQWKVAEWIEADPELRALCLVEGVDPFHVLWNQPAYPYIEPLKDASTELMRAANGLNSERRIHAERNRDIDEIQDEIIADRKRGIAAAMQAASDVKLQFPDAEVSWRDFLPMPNPQGITLSLTEQVGEVPGQSQQQSGGKHAA